jgi:hypothetical protein
VDVADTGPGVDAETLGSIFKPFVTTKTGGMGIGLAVSRSIVNAHEGRLWAENGVEGGATFHIVLPAAVATGRRGGRGVRFTATQERSESRRGMVSVKRSAGMVLVVAMTLAGFGCASSGSAKPIGPNDLPSLAGKWSGNMSLPTGQNAFGTLDFAPNGDYVVQASGFNAQGKATVKDGTLVLVPTSSSGPLDARMAGRTSTASLTQLSDGALKLTGFGHSSAGPFDFELTRGK